MHVLSKSLFYENIAPLHIYPSFLGNKYIFPPRISGHFKQSRKSEIRFIFRKQILCNKQTSQEILLLSCSYEHHYCAFYKKKSQQRTLSTHTKKQLLKKSLTYGNYSNIFRSIKIAMFLAGKRVIQEKKSEIFICTC